MDKIVHFEIPADDVERAKKFYSSVFKWDMNTIPSMGYTVITTVPTDKERIPKESGFINGGMMKRTNEIRNPIITINVKDIKESIKKIEDAGGENIKTPFEVGDMGIAAYFEDSEGNIVGLWQNKK